MCVHCAYPVLRNTFPKNRDGDHGRVHVSTVPTPSGTPPSASLLSRIWAIPVQIRNAQKTSCGSKPTKSVERILCRSSRLESVFAFSSSSVPSRSGDNSGDTSNKIRHTFVENIYLKVTLVNFQFRSVKSLSHVRLFVTPWTAACQASLSITNSWSLLKVMSIMSVMPSNHLILCRPLLFPPSPFPSIRVFSSESVLCIRWECIVKFSTFLKWKSLLYIREHIMLI